MRLVESSKVKMTGTPRLLGTLVTMRDQRDCHEIDTYLAEGVVLISY